MSNWREQLADEQEAKTLTAWFEEYFHVPVLVGLIGFIFWNRIRNMGNYVIDGTTYFSGNDPWYHYRSTQYAVKNFPETMPFEAWTYFPYGTATGQFGTIYNQAIALVALIVGLGNPSESLVQDIFLIAPVFLAVLITIPTYIMGRRLGGRVGGLVGVGLIAFAPDRLLSFTLAGHVDHHAVEVLFMSLSILGVMVALTVAEKEKPVWELVQAREFGALRGTIGWSMLAGIAMGLYMWAWPPGVWTLGILAVFFTIHMCIEHLRGRSPEHAAFVGVISALTAGFLQLSTVRNVELAVASRSILQPVFAFAVAGGIIFLALLSRKLDSRGEPKAAYPAAVGGLIVVSAVTMALLLPSLFDFLFSQVDRVLGFVTSPGTTAGTIGEAQPMEFERIRDQYQFAIFTAAIGAFILLVKQIFDKEPKGEQLLVVVWAAFMMAATLTQARFAVYLTVPFGILNGALVGVIVDMMGTEDNELNIETYQVLTVAVVILLVFVPLIGMPVLIKNDNTAMSVADDRSRPGAVVMWDDSLQWLNNNTPEEGKFANPDGEKMEYYGSYKETNDFEYPAGTYGVMSWWDYGHWITTRAERIPNANPFQEGANDAARFLLAQNEDEGLNVLSNVSESEQAQSRFVMVDWKMVETSSRVGGKFFAPIQFHDDWQQSDFYTRMAQVSERGRIAPIAPISKQPYYNSMVARLYHYHGSSKSPEPIVVESGGQERAITEDGGQTIWPAPGQTQGTPVKVFDNMSAARDYVSQNPNSQIGGIGAAPNERVEALDHFRLVHMSNESALGQSRDRIDTYMEEYGVGFGFQASLRQTVQGLGLQRALQQQVASENPDMSSEKVNQQASRRAFNLLLDTTPTWTKTFERVPGATVEVSGPENTTVQVSVPLEPKNGQPFEYTRRHNTGEDGTFTMTVPYSTEGYDEYGVEEGYTEPSVKASGPYSIRTGLQAGENNTLVRWSAQTNVSEAHVVGENTSTISVTMEQREINLTGTPGEGSSDDGSGEEGSENGDEGSSNDGSDSARALAGADEITGQLVEPEQTLNTIAEPSQRTTPLAAV